MLWQERLNETQILFEIIQVLQKVSGEDNCYKVFCVYWLGCVYEKQD